MNLNCEIKFDKLEDIKKYLKLMNEFRIEYFNDPNVPKITESDFAKNKQYRIIPFMLLNGTTPLGIAEITCGNIFKKKRLDISTVYEDHDAYLERRATTFLRYSGSPPLRKQKISDHTQFLSKIDLFCRSLVPLQRDPFPPKKSPVSVSECSVSLMAANHCSSRVRAGRRVSRGAEMNVLGT